MSYGNYPDLSNIQRILIIQFRHFGDVLLTTPLFSVLKSRFPHVDIDVLVYRQTAEVLENDPHINQIFQYDSKWKKSKIWVRIFKEIQFYFLLRKQKYDLVLNLTEGDRGAFFTKYSGAKFKVGYEFPGQKKWKHKVYDFLSKVCGPPRHKIERNLDILRRIGIFPKIEEREVQFIIPKQAKRKVEALLHSHQISSYLLIHPTSRWRFKCWPIEKLRSFIQALLAFPLSIIFTSGPDEEEIKWIDSCIKDIQSSKILNLAGKTSIAELAALIEKSETLLCVDSFIFHLANSLQSSVIALFGPTCEITWGAWKNPHATIVTEKLPCRPCFMDGCGGGKLSDCLDQISVSRMLHIIEQKCPSLWKNYNMNSSPR